jgi:acetoin utilization protein AcuB
MIVRMYMSQNVETISPDSSLGIAISKMKEHRIRRLVVTSGDSVAGIVCQHDLVRAFPNHVNPFSAMGLEEAASNSDVGSIMKHPVITVDQNSPIEHAASLMKKHHVGGLPVTNENRLVGIITESDIFRAFTKLLSGNDGSFRITFDVTEDENVLTFLATSTQKYELVLLSFISFHDNDRRMAVARVLGDQVQQFISELWESGHRVVNIVKSEDASGASDG